MGWAEGLLGGFVERKREYEGEQLDLAAKRSDRESRIYEALLSSPDPEIQSLAAAGLLESAAMPKRKGGLSGWLGQMEENPYLPRIQQLIGTPVLGTEQIAGTPTLPSKSMTGYLATPPPVSGSLAQAEGGPTQGDQMAPLQVDETVSAKPEAPSSALITREVPSRPTTTTRPVFKPRQIFLSPEEAMLRNKRAAAQGDVEGEVAGLVAAGFTEEQARALVAKKYERRYGMGAGGYQSVAGEMPDGTPAWGVFDRTKGIYTDPEDGTPLEGFRPRTTTGSVSLGQYAERAARELGYASAIAAGRAGPDAMRRVNERAAELQREAAKETTLGRGEATEQIGLLPKDRAQYISQWSDDWARSSDSARKINTSAAQMRTAWQSIDTSNPATVAPAAEAIIVLFERTLDPNSVVREAEARRPGTFQGLLTRIQGALDRLRIGGATVPLSELQQYVTLSEQIAETASALQQANRARITALAKSFQVDPTLIFGGDVIGAPPAAPAATPGVKPQVGVRPPGAQAAPATAAPRAPGKTKLDSTAPGVFMDETGKIIYR